jgi:hypothetical protein
MANEMKMVERMEPRFVNFLTGDVVEGVLCTAERVSIKEKPCIRYTVKQDDGFYVQLIGTHQLSTKLRTEDRGHYVSIRCEGEDVTVKKGDNCMKVFKVLISEKPAVNGVAFTDGTEITDNDIPF